jgi:hypothetical protein
MAVFCTIYVLDTYNREDEIPKWLQKLTIGVLARIACYKGCCKGSNKRVNPEPEALVIEPTDNGKVAPADDDTPETEEADLTWKDVGNILDKCFLRLFLLTAFVTCVVCMSLMGANY